MGDINHYMPTKYCKGGRLLHGEIYELIEENDLQIIESSYFPKNKPLKVVIDG